MHWFNGMPHIYPRNCPFPFDDLHPSSNPPIPRLAALTTPSDIQIQSAVLPHQTDRQMGWTTSLYTKSHLRLIVSDAANTKIQLSLREVA